MKGFYERLEREVVKVYKDYILYQIYGVLNNERIPLYKTCKNREVV